MNNHKSACFVLVLLIAGMLYGVNSIRNSTSDARTGSEAARSEATTSEQQMQLAQIQLKTLDSKTSELRRIYSEWEPHFMGLQRQQDAEKRVADVIRDGNIIPISRKFEPRELDKNDLISEALVGDIVIEDDYAKTMNWLGSLEEAIPNCRIMKCNFTRGDRGNNIHLELQIQIPLLKS